MKTALIFELDAGLRITLVRIFGRLGWEVDATHELDRALRCLSERQPDIVLLSWPEDEGTSLLKAVKAHCSRLETPVILMLVASTEIDSQAVLELGAWDILLKPVSAVAVHTVVNRWAFERKDSEACLTEN